MTTESTAQSRKLFCTHCMCATEHRLYAAPGRSVLLPGNWKCIPCKKEAGKQYRERKARKN